MAKHRQIIELLDAAVLHPRISGPEGCAALVGVSPKTVFRWLIQSRMGHPKFQEITWHDTTAAFHQHFERHARALTSVEIQQSALDMAVNGTDEQVFFQGRRMTEKIRRPEYADVPEDELWLLGDAAFMEVPTLNHRHPPVALVTKMLESWDRRYQPQQNISVEYGGTLRLERGTKPKVDRKQVFEADTPGERRGGYLALPAPAVSPDEMAERERQGDFAPSPVKFTDASGVETVLSAPTEPAGAPKAPVNHSGAGKEPSEPTELPANRLGDGRERTGAGRPPPGGARVDNVGAFGVRRIQR